MSNNIEIKAHARDLAGLKNKVKNLCGNPEGLLFQRDVFYNVSKYRLKLRNVNGNSELIIYDRENKPGPKHSKYLRLPIPFPQAVHAVLRTILGVRGTIEKKRTLFFFEKTRIHLDEVDQLGTFLEFEVVLNTEDSPEKGIGTANALMNQLGIKEEDLIDASYIDLMESDCSKHPDRKQRG